MVVVGQSRSSEQKNSGNSLLGTGNFQGFSYAADMPAPPIKSEMRKKNGFSLIVKAANSGSDVCPRPDGRGQEVVRHWTRGALPC